MAGIIRYINKIQVFYYTIEKISSSMSTLKRFFFFCDFFTHARSRAVIRLSCCIAFSFTMKNVHGRENRYLLMIIIIVMIICINAMRESHDRDNELQNAGIKLFSIYL